MIISIASGKGGTGKTTLALMLASVRDNTCIVDCDVEEPNCHLFMQPEWEEEKIVTVMRPSINPDKCNGCGRCAEVCLFNALAVAGKALLFEDLCHGCGGCILACPAGAITESAKPVGSIAAGTAAKVAPGSRLVHGLLKVGTPAAGPLIKAVKQERSVSEHIIIDCPPGTSCSMVAGVSGSDYCLLVAEPTPFGQHDLNLAVGITKLLELPAGVVINKSDGGAGDELIEESCRAGAIPILAKIPHNERFAAMYSEGIVSDEYSRIAQEIWLKIEKAGGVV